ncbi:Detected protein of confused Function [Hibiscus syriacus]|uniref:Detected protein of confused Function n=1 Tax=Hibiscus syriacus TaxID=106335 RepID=A0A6A2X717_HIBSY|nr:Detected protein of confused Function [Hibiscus syriacus]
MKVKDVFSWNAMVTGYSQVGRFEKALGLFEKMKENIELGVVTWSSVIASYAQQDRGYEALSVFRQMQGKEIHGYVIKSVLNYDWNDPGDDLMVINGLIDMYDKCESTNIARFMFDSVVPSNRNVVTWTFMIGGFAQHGEANDALKLFSEMFQDDMYSKSGNIHAARVVFDNMQHKNSVSWTSLLTSYGMQGYGDEAIEVLDDMRAAGFVPDGITFLVLLYVCCHSGMIDQGIKFFESMHTEYDVIPGLEHYACMIDLLGRASKFDQALKLIRNMPMEPTAIVWTALLSGCRIHGHVEIGKKAAAKLR